LTFIEGVKLEREALERAEQWQMQFPRPFAYLYGTINVAVRQPGTPPWERVFKYANQGPELLFIWANTHPKVKNKMSLTILYSTDVWMRGSNYLGDQISPEEADENLSRLVNITRSVYDATKKAELPILSVGVDTNIPLWQPEYERVRKAFAEF